MGRFINPFTDFGFKFLFGREVEKELLIDFLNDLLVGEHVITDIQFLNNEQQPEVKTERGLIYDIYCRTNTGEHIIVEMQNREQPYFKDRALFYLSRAITQQARKGIWNFQLDAVYGVFFMNFVMDKDIPSKIRTDVILSDRDTGKLFNSKFRQISDGNRKRYHIDGYCTCCQDQQERCGRNPYMITEKSSCNTQPQRG